LDLITCIGVLKPIQNHDAAVRSVFSLLWPGGHIVLTFPFSDRRYVTNVYELSDATYWQDSQRTRQVFDSRQVDAWLEQNRGKIAREELYEVFSGDLWTFGEYINRPRITRRGDRPAPPCSYPGGEGLSACQP
jgi:hypothetical protein